MAEGFLRSILTPDVVERVRVISAGTGAPDDSPPTAMAVETAAAHGIDIQSHRSRRLTPVLLHDSDLILCMEPGHVARAQELAPEAMDPVPVGEPVAGLAVRGGEPVFANDVASDVRFAGRDHGERYASRYEINMLRCIFCGMCEEACPVDAIELTSLFDLTGRSREEMIFDKEKLLSIYDQTKDAEPMQSASVGGTL